MLHSKLNKEKCWSYCQAQPQLQLSLAKIAFFQANPATRPPIRASTFQARWVGGWLGGWGQVNIKDHLSPAKLELGLSLAIINFN